MHGCTLDYLWISLGIILLVPISSFLPVCFRISPSMPSKAFLKIEATLLAVSPSVSLSIFHTRSSTWTASTWWKYERERKWKLRPTDHVVLPELLGGGVHLHLIGKLNETISRYTNNFCTLSFLFGAMMNFNMNNVVNYPWGVLPLWPNYYPTMPKTTKWPKLEK